MKPAILCDLDSTLCDTRHRWHVSPIDPVSGVWLHPPTTLDARERWEKYSLACPQDTLIQGTAELLRCIPDDILLFFVSGRDQVALSETEAWLEMHSVEYDGIFLKDKVSNWAGHKVDTIRTLRRAGIDPVLFIEDWEPAAQEIEKETGVRVLRVRPPYTEDDRLWPRYAM